MKKFLFLFLLAASIGATASTTPQKSISYNIKNHFTATFADAENVEWKLTDKFVKASFILDEIKMEAFYSTDGDLLGTSKIFAFDKLPKKALKKILAEYPYPPYKLKDCIEFTNADGDKNYFVSFEKESNKTILKVSTYGDVENFNTQK